MKHNSNKIAFQEQRKNIFFFWNPVMHMFHKTYNPIVQQKFCTSLSAVNCSLFSLEIIASTTIEIGGQVLQNFQRSRTILSSVCMNSAYDQVLTHF